MLAYLLLGVALLLALLVVGRLFATANPATLAQIFRWSLVLVLGALGLVSVLRGNALFGILMGAAAALIWRGGLPGWSRGSRRGTPGGASNVETGWLAMSLDHDTGAVDGEVRRGRFSGRRLSGLGLDDLLDLYDEINADDPRSAPLLESFLDRVHDGWRDEHAKRPPPGGESGKRRRGWGRSEAETMSRQDALKILGLAGDPSADQIKEAHRKLMLQHHPDRGGSDYFAAKINQAKDVLLGDR